MATKSVARPRKIRPVTVTPAEREKIAMLSVKYPLDKARALTSVLQQLGEEDTGVAANDLIQALREDPHPPETREWLHGVVGAALKATLDEIATEFQKYAERKAVA